MFQIFFFPRLSVLYGKYESGMDQEIIYRTKCILDVSGLQHDQSEKITLKDTSITQLCKESSPYCFLLYFSCHPYVS